MGIRRSGGETAFAAANTVVLVLAGLSMLLPFLHIVAKSLSDEAHVLAKDVLFWPLRPSTGAYRWVLGSPQFVVSFTNSLIVTACGTTLSMLVTVITAFPVTRDGMPGRTALILLYVFTMFFGGGIVPTYLVVKGLGLTNTLLALFVPAALAPFQLIIMIRFFRNVPDGLYESARIDGATNVRILFSVFVPLSKAAIATLSMFYAVAYWNDYFSGLIYITNRRLVPLQVFLREMIIDESYLSSLVHADELMRAAPESIRGATIVAAVTPILLVYPFVQKHFVKGLLIGALKG